MSKTKRIQLSLSQRLLVGALLWVLCSLVATGLLLTQLFKQHIEEQLYKELNVHMLQLISQMEQEAEAPLEVRTHLSDPRFEQPLSGLYWQIQGSQDSTLALYSRSLWDERLNLPVPDGITELRTHYEDPLLGSAAIQKGTQTKNMRFSMLFWVPDDYILR